MEIDRGPTVTGIVKSRVGDVALVLVELAGREEPAVERGPCADRLLMRICHVGITGYEHEFRCAVGNDPVECREQRVDFALPPVQRLWDQQSVRDVVSAQREWIEATMRLPFRQAPPKAGFQTGGCLVALLNGARSMHMDFSDVDRAAAQDLNEISGGA